MNMLGSFLVKLKKAWTALSVGVRFIRRVRT
jgi:hypothetical protein